MCFNRKKARQLLEQTSARFHSDADDLVNKHNKRWTNKINAVRLNHFYIYSCNFRLLHRLHLQLQQKIKKLKFAADEKMKVTIPKP